VADPWQKRTATKALRHKETQGSYVEKVAKEKNIILSVSVPPWRIRGKKKNATKALRHKETQS